MIDHISLYSEKFSVLVSQWKSSEVLNKTLLKEAHLNHHLSLLKRNEKQTDLSYDAFYNLKFVSDLQLSLSHTSTVIISTLGLKSNKEFLGIDIELTSRVLTSGVEQWIKRNLKSHWPGMSNGSEPLLPIQRWCRYEAQLEAEKKLSEFHDVSLIQTQINSKFTSMNWENFTIEICHLEIY